MNEAEEFKLVSLSDSEYVDLLINARNSSAQELRGILDVEREGCMRKKRNEAEESKLVESINKLDGYEELTDSDYVDMLISARNHGAHDLRGILEVPREGWVHKKRDVV